MIPGRAAVGHRPHLRRAPQTLLLLCGAAEETKMKTISKFVCAAAALALLAGVLLHVTQANEPKALPNPEAFLKALAEAGKPGPEHKKLQPFVGQWTYTMKLWTDPGQPPAEFKGTIE